MVPVFDTHKMSGGMGKTSAPLQPISSASRCSKIYSSRRDVPSSPSSWGHHHHRRRPTVHKCINSACGDQTLSGCQRLLGTRICESVGASEGERNCPPPMYAQICTHTLYHHNSTLNDHHLLPQTSSASILPLRPPRRMRPTRTPTSWHSTPTSLSLLLSPSVPLSLFTAFKLVSHSPQPQPVYSSEGRYKS